MTEELLITISTLDYYVEAKGFFASFNVNNLLDKKIDECIRKAAPSLILNYQIYYSLYL